MEQEESSYDDKLIFGVEHCAGNFEEIRQLYDFGTATEKDLKKRYKQLVADNLAPPLAVFKSHKKQRKWAKKNRKLQAEAAQFNRIMSGRNLVEQQQQQQQKRMTEQYQEFMAEQQQQQQQQQQQLQQLQKQQQRKYRASLVSPADEFALKRRCHTSNPRRNQVDKMIGALIQKEQASREIRARQAAGSSHGNDTDCITISSSSEEDAKQESDGDRVLQQQMLEQRGAIARVKEKRRLQKLRNKSKSKATQLQELMRLRRPAPPPRPASPPPLYRNTAAINSDDSDSDGSSRSVIQIFSESDESSDGDEGDRESKQSEIASLPSTSLPLHGVAQTSSFSRTLPPRRSPKRFDSSLTRSNIQLNHTDFSQATLLSPPPASTVPCDVVYISSDDGDAPEVEVPATPSPMLMEKSAVVNKLEEQNFPARAPYRNVLAVDTDASESDTDALESDTSVLAPDTDALTTYTNVLAPDTNVLAPNTDALDSYTNMLVHDTDVLDSDTNLLAPDTDQLTPDTDALECDVNVLVPDTNVLAPYTNDLIFDADASEPYADALTPDTDAPTPGKTALTPENDVIFIISDDDDADDKETSSAAPADAERKRSEDSFISLETGGNAAATEVKIDADEAYNDVDLLDFTATAIAAEMAGFDSQPVETGRDREGETSEKERQERVDLFYNDGLIECFDGERIDDDKSSPIITVTTPRASSSASETDDSRPEVTIADSPESPAPEDRGVERACAEAVATDPVSRVGPEKDGLQVQKANDQEEEKRKEVAAEKGGCVYHGPSPESEELDILVAGGDNADEQYGTEEPSQRSETNLIDLTDDRDDVDEASTAPEIHIPIASSQKSAGEETGGKMETSIETPPMPVYFPDAEQGEYDLLLANDPAPSPVADPEKIANDKDVLPEAAVESVGCAPVKSVDDNAPVESADNASAESSPEAIEYFQLVSPINRTSEAAPEKIATPVKTTQVKTTLVKATLVKATPVKTILIKTTPVKTQPVKTQPVKTQPVKTQPVKTQPVKTQPVKTQPVKTQPVKTTPVKTTPVKTTPVKPVNTSQTPVKTTPVLTTPVKATPVIITPVKATPVITTPVKATPVKATPVKTTPVKTTPVKTTPVKTTPVKPVNTSQTPVITTPVITTPVKTTPVKTTPVKTTPVKTTPVKTTPVKTTPVKTTPVKTTPVKTTLVQTTLVQTTPVQTTPVITTPTKKPVAANETPRKAPSRSKPKRPRRTMICSPTHRSSLKPAAEAKRSMFADDGKRRSSRNLTEVITISDDDDELPLVSGARKRTAEILLADEAEEEEEEYECWCAKQRRLHLELHPEERRRVEEGLIAAATRVTTVAGRKRKRNGWQQGKRAKQRNTEAGNFIPYVCIECDERFTMEVDCMIVASVSFFGHSWKAARRAFPFPKKVLDWEFPRRFRYLMKRFMEHSLDENGELEFDKSQRMYTITCDKFLARYKRYYKLSHTVRHMRTYDEGIGEPFTGITDMDRVDFPETVLHMEELQANQTKEVTKSLRFDGVIDPVVVAHHQIFGRLGSTSCWNELRRLDYCKRGITRSFVERRFWDLMRRGLIEQQWFADRVCVRVTDQQFRRAVRVYKNSASFRNCK